MWCFAQFGAICRILKIWKISIGFFSRFLNCKNGTKSRNTILCNLVIFLLAKENFIILLAKVKVGPPITGLLTMSTKVIPKILSNLTLGLNFVFLDFVGLDLRSSLCYFIKAFHKLFDLPKSNENKKKWVLIFWCKVVLYKL